MFKGEGKHSSLVMETWIEKLEEQVFEIQSEEFNRIQNLTDAEAEKEAKERCPVIKPSDEMWGQWHQLIINIVGLQKFAEDQKQD